MADESRLQPEAIELLLSAVAGKGDCEGVIAVAKADYGTLLSFGLERKTLKTDRDAARYHSAIELLSGRGLIAAQGAETWHVTAEGKAKADELQAFGQQLMEWDG